MINASGFSPGRGRRALLWSLGLLAVLAAGGCDALKQGFDKTWVDPSQPIQDDQFTSITEIRSSFSLNDQETITVPKEAVDPTGDDLLEIHQDYRLAPGDTIDVQIYELYQQGQDWVGRRHISETGFVTLPKIGSLYLSGLTEHQAELAVGKAYREAGLLDEPNVAVSAETRLTKTFSVSGPFNTPGTFNILSSDFRLLNALGMVGGLANTTAEWIWVIRTEGGQASLASPPSAAPSAGPPSAAPPAPPPGPGGAAPLELPGGPAAAPPPAAPPAGRSMMTVPGGPGRSARTAAVGKDLEEWTPAGLAAPGGERGPGPAAGPGKGEPPAGGALQPISADGDWMLVNGTWTLVPQPATRPGLAGGPTSAPEAQGPRTRVIKIPLNPLRAGETRYNIVIRDKDVIVAPMPVIGEFYLTGNVNRPGVYSLTDRRISVGQAIAAGGGFGPLAIPSRVQLIRRITPDQTETRMIDVGRIFEGKDPDYVLKPYDLINVGTSVYAPFLAVLRNAFRATYGVGFVYDRNFADIDSYSPRNNTRK